MTSISMALNGHNITINGLYNILLFYNFSKNTDPETLNTFL